jgi:hypothetical protein
MKRRAVMVNRRGARVSFKETSCRARTAHVGMHVVPVESQCWNVRVEVGMLARHVSARGLAVVGGVQAVVQPAVSLVCNAAILARWACMMTSSSSWCDKSSVQPLSDLSIPGGARRAMLLAAKIDRPIDRLRPRARALLPLSRPS